MFVVVVLVVVVVVGGVGVVGVVGVVVVVVAVVAVVVVIIFKTVSCRYSYDSIISLCNDLSLDVAPEPCHF